jgi:hypothetical protein
MIEWTQNEGGLRIAVPERRSSEHAVAFAISGVLPADAAGK